MPAEHIVIEKKAGKRILKLPLRIQEKILLTLDRLAQNPLLGRKLEGELSDYLKFRIGDYRLIYRFDSKKSIVVVVKIEHRQGVYR